ncbi:DDE superfamily endonuclease [Rhizoctonia solani]|uniref:DDE superfamily endonuclease n=1 Tax=Rhizoctonia solani TaxID=456999 RepID=A0A8H7I1M8_9AGAM|nr:DDE superfamily endonuclease [Rhizoctonia solani]
MWGCIAHGKKGPLIWLELLPCIAGKKGRSRGGGLTSAGYAEQVLKGPLKEFLDELEAERGHKILIVEDGAPLHKGPQAREARAALGIEQLAHPSGSSRSQCHRAHMASPQITRFQGAWSSEKC